MLTFVFERPVVLKELQLTNTYVQKNSVVYIRLNGSAGVASHGHQSVVSGDGHIGFAGCSDLTQKVFLKVGTKSSYKWDINSMFQISIILYS